MEILDFSDKLRQHDNKKKQNFFLVKMFETIICLTLLGNQVFWVKN